ncbi:Malonate-semialdehyde dehydrogenase [Afipia felis]
MKVDLLSNLPPRIHMILEEGAKAGSSRPAFTDERGAVWSYQRVIDAIEAVAAEMASLGVRPGDRIMVVGENSIAAIVLMYAASRLDAWVVMANARLSPHELDLIEGDCKPRRVFYTHAVSSEADAAACRRGAAVQVLTGIGEIKVGPLETNSVPETVHADSARQVATRFDFIKAGKIPTGAAVNQEPELIKTMGQRQTCPDVKLFVDGLWCDGISGHAEPVFNPATGGRIEQVAHASVGDLDRAINASISGFEVWRQTSAFDRYKLMRATEKLRERIGAVAEILTLEQGKHHWPCPDQNMARCKNDCMKLGS